MNFSPYKSERQAPLVLLSAAFPPEPAAGAARIAGMVRYLPAQGLLPIVVATQDAVLPDDCDPRITIHAVRKHHPSPGSRASRGGKAPLWRRAARDTFAVPDRYRSWSKRAAAQAWRLARQYNAPLLVSAPPVSAAWWAARLRRANDTPLFLDFRDAWLADPMRADYYRNPLRRLMEERMEAETLSKATVCFAASPGMVRSFQSKYPAFAHRIQLLLNGFDESDWKRLPAPPALPSDRLNIVYTGSFLSYQTPKYVFRALARLDDPQMHLYIVGDYGGKSEELLDKQFSTLKGRVTVLPRMQRSRCLAWQRAADLLLLVITPGPRGDESHMVITSKCFEYLRAGKPILATVPPGGDADRLLAQFSWVTRTGADDVSAILQALLLAKREDLEQPPSPAQLLGSIQHYRRDWQMAELAAAMRKTVRAAS